MKQAFNNYNKNHDLKICLIKRTLYPPQIIMYRLSYETATCPVLPGGIESKSDLLPDMRGFSSIENRET